MKHNEELLRQIQDEVAKDYGYSNYFDVWRKGHQGLSDGFAMSIVKRYAEAMLAEKEREIAELKEKISGLYGQLYGTADWLDLAERNYELLKSRIDEMTQKEVQQEIDRVKRTLENLKREHKKPKP